ncbi:hypothetical protein HDU76_004967 [Blyttiomyces sp. JEL0837]|nr:hypothetical protein HDU76_004967 [Blyttiomyces sp. JEL0837]
MSSNSSVRITIASNANQKQRSVVILKRPSPQLDTTSSSTTSSTAPTPSPSLRDQILQFATKKFRLKKPSRVFTSDGLEIHATTTSHTWNDDDLALISCGEEFIGTSKYVPSSSTTSTPSNQQQESRVTILSDSSYVDSEAIDQLNKTAKLAGVLLSVGYPDLNPGLRFPVGASFIVKGRVYPELIGGDIGCGMSFYTLPTLPTTSLTKPSKIASRLQSLESQLPPHIIESWLSINTTDSTHMNSLQTTPTLDSSIGSIGGGNHFAELQIVEKVVDEDALNRLGLDPRFACLLVHSGSRKLGKMVLEEVLKAVDDGNDEEEESKVKDSGNSRYGDGAYKGEYAGVWLEEGSDAFKRYMEEHDRACGWAKRNREMIAKRFVESLLGGSGDGDGDDGITVNDDDRQYSELHQGGDTTNFGDASTTTSATTSPIRDRKCIKLIDIWHNNDYVYVHRKGAAPSDLGIVPIPGSRGAFTYLVQPIGDQSANAYSLPHGAGRKWTRSKAAVMVKNKMQAQSGGKSRGGGGSAGSDLMESLSVTSLGSCVVCEDRELMVEEAPEAYKDIGDVVKDVEGFARVIAIMRPVVTYKTRRG